MKITIGEVVIEMHAGDPGSYSAALEARKDAPPTPGEDSRIRLNAVRALPSEWRAFCEATGLDALFYGDGGFLTGRTGLKRLLPEHHETAKQALERWKELESVEETPQGAAHLERLTWLEWWMRWALTNCRKPAVYISP